ncbi:MAG: tRNA pseudouridine(38-40) synthase TruA [Chloroflexi bacterium]|nr:tRNA pseudouridine(38-40) synthase TruA [Chloroflexota bacterium]
MEQRPQRVRAVVCYDGTDFLGFQRQATGRTVQAVLEQALLRCSSSRAVVPAGRTDTGVHAAGQVVHFDYTGRVPVDRLSVFLNDRLPRDVSVISCQPVPPSFHARRSALSRTYRYTLIATRTRDPLRERYAWRIDRPLHQELLCAALAAVKGQHSFRHFGEIPESKQQRHIIEQHRGWQRKMLSTEIKEQGDTLHITLEADAFLTHMARALIGTFVAISRERCSLARLREALSDSRSSDQLAPMAPPQGLVLWSVQYPEGLDAAPLHQGS